MQNQTIKCEMNFLITALQGHQSPCKMGGESASAAYGPSCVSFHELIFFSVAMKIAPISLSYLSGTRLE